jgi:hypothetical protein
MARIWLCVVGAFAVASLAAMPAAAAPPAGDGGVAPAVQPADWSDFDADGFQDLAIGAPNADNVTPNGTESRTGTVFVFYGTADGLSTDRVQEWHQDVSGVNDQRDPFDFFGSALAAGDFDQDGVGDLAIGVPREDRPIGGATRVDAGEVQVLYGTAGVGLTATGDDSIVPSAPIATADDWENAEFGATLASLDMFDATRPVGPFGDGFADLAIGAPGFANDEGRAFLVAGPDIGPDPDFPIICCFGGAEARVGSALAAGDFDDDGDDELAVGIPFATAFDGPDPIDNAGMVSVIERGDALENIALSFSGDGQVPQDDDRFGSALAAGDTDGDGRDDLAVGAPGRDVDGVQFAGAVFVYHPTEDGFNDGPSVTSVPQTFHEGQAAIASGPVVVERFGHSLAFANFGRGAGLDLAIGVQRERVGSAPGAGAVYVLYHDGDGLSATGSQRWTQDTTGIPDTSEREDNLGAAMTVGQFRRGGSHDLVIGAPREGLRSGGFAFPDAGVIHVLYGTGANGLTANNDQRFTMSSPGLPGVRAGSRFGAALR